MSLLALVVEWVYGHGNNEKALCQFCVFALQFWHCIVSVGFSKIQVCLMLHPPILDETIYYNICQKMKNSTGTKRWRWVVQTSVIKEKNIYRGINLPYFIFLSSQYDFINIFHRETADSAANLVWLSVWMRLTLTKHTYIGLEGSAWCPGGLTTAKPFCAEEDDVVNHCTTFTVLQAFVM